MKCKQSLCIKLSLFVFIMQIATLVAQSKAKILLDDVSKKVRGYDQIAIDFKYTLENTSENIRQDTKGDVIMQGDKYRLNFLGMTRLFDGKNIYTISPEDEEVIIETPIIDDEDENIMVTPSNMLTFYETGHTYRFISEKSINGRKIQNIEITPIDSNSEIQTIILGIDTLTKHIFNITQIGKNGTKTILTVKSFKTDLPVSSSVFTFEASKYQGYYINTLD